MRGVEVIALHEVFRQAFPVRVPYLFLKVVKLAFLVVIVADVRFERAKCFAGRRRVAVDVHEDEVLPDRRIDFRQRTSRCIEILALLHQRSAFQLAVEFITPCVIGARVYPRISTAECDEIATMPAYVGKHVYVALGVTLNEQRLSDDLGREVVAVTGDLPDMADANPGASKDPPAFEFSEVSG